MYVVSLNEKYIQKATITAFVQNISLGREKGLEKRVFIMLRFLGKMLCILLQNLHQFVVSSLCTKYLSLKNLYKFIPEK